jgi:uncharacterized protein YcbK (DUF882 family)
MKSVSELNPRKYPLTEEIEKNLEVLFEKLIRVQELYGSDFVVTSGLRSEALQKSLIDQGKTKATKSKHLIGQAADIQDHDGKLARWVMLNLKVMEDLGLYMEAFASTRGWVHFQTVAPKSGKRVFFP